MPLQLPSLPSPLKYYCHHQEGVSGDGSSKGETALSLLIKTIYILLLNDGSKQHGERISL